MRQLKTLLMSLALCMPLAAQAQSAGSPSMDDAVISMRVKSALIANDATKASQIKVESRRGLVQLSGFVDSEAMRAEAATTAKAVGGVREIQNNLMIRDANRSASQAVVDTVIAAKVKGELAGKSGYDTATVVNVDVNSGVVELSGFVATPAEKAQAAAVARSVNGVKDVRNNISLKPQG